MASFVLTDLAKVYLFKRLGREVDILGKEVAVIENHVEKI